MKNNYIEQALRTESVEGAGRRVKNKPALIEGLHHFNKMVEDQVDNIKKYIYYGKDSTTIQAAPKMMPDDGLDISEENMRLLHAGLGMMTEAAEFLGPVLKAIRSNQKLDKVNLREEIGDLQWYQAIACDVLDTNFEEVQDINIAKLTARYPEKFDSDKAINRDLETERKILEGNK